MSTFLFISSIMKMDTNTLPFLGKQPYTLTELVSSDALQESKLAL